MRTQQTLCFYTKLQPQLPQRTIAKIFTKFDEARDGVYKEGPKFLGWKKLGSHMSCKVPNLAKIIQKNGLEKVAFSALSKEEENVFYFQF